VRDFRRDHARLGRRRRGATKTAHPAAAQDDSGPGPESEAAAAAEHAPAPDSGASAVHRKPGAKGKDSAHRSESRSKVVLSVLIALTSLLGALAAWQAETASMRRDAANGSGFAKSVANEQAQATIRANVASELLDYERAKSYASQAAALRSQAQHAAGPDSVRLRSQAALQSDLASRIISNLNQDAFGPGHVFDPTKAFQIDYAQAKNISDFDSATEFALAENQATKAARLVGLTVLLIAAAFFFTLAQVSSRRSTSRLYLGGGLVVLVSSSVLLLIVVAAT
jgi:hypothetical protein